MPQPLTRVRTVVSAQIMTGIILACLAVSGPATTRARAQDDMARGKPADVGFSSERLKRIDDVIRRHIDEKRIAGAVTLVARRGRVVHYQAQGLMDIDSKRPMSKDTLFRMASST